MVSDSRLGSTRVTDAGVTVTENAGAPAKLKLNNIKIGLANYY